MGMVVVGDQVIAAWISRAEVGTTSGGLPYSSFFRQTPHSHAVAGLLGRTLLLTYGSVFELASGHGGMKCASLACWRDAGTGSSTEFLLG